MKKLTAVLIIICLAQVSIAQNYGGPKKGSAVGFSGNLVDFSASIPKVGKVDPGFSVMYWHGLSSHIDYSVRYNGLFTEYSKKADVQNKYTNEFEGSLHARVLANNHLFNPFATAGIGIGSYGQGVWAPYVPLGLGLQVNLNNEGYLFLQGIVLMRCELSRLYDVRKIRSLATQVSYQISHVNPSSEPCAEVAATILVNNPVAFKIHKRSIHALTCSVYT